MTLTKFKILTAELMDEMPGPSQQGSSGAGPGVLDSSNTSDGESMSALDKIQPTQLGVKRKTRIGLPKTTHNMVTYEDLIGASDDLKNWISDVAKNHGDEKLDDVGDIQFRKFPRPNFEM